MTSTSVYKVGVIGAGNMGTSHSTWLSDIPGIKVSGVMDQDVSKAQRLKENVKADYATQEADDIMNDEEIGAVLICTHHDSHAPLAIQAASAQKRIFMEKPLAMNEPDCYKIKRALDESGTDMFMGFIRRFSPIGAKAKQVIARPKIVFGQITEPTWGCDAWAQDPHRGGGNVISQGCHLFDLVCWYADSDPVEIFAYGGELTHEGTGLIDNIVCNIRFANGVLGNVIIGDSGKVGNVQKFFLEILCGDRTASIDGFQDLYLWGINSDEMHLPKPGRGDE